MTDRAPERASSTSRTKASDSSSPSPARDDPTTRDRFAIVFELLEAGAGGFDARHVREQLQVLARQLYDAGNIRAADGVTLALAVAMTSGFGLPDPALNDARGRVEQLVYAALEAYGEGAR